MQYDIVDVFSNHAFMGNPVAVVFPDRKLNKDEMLAITAWFNLSETVFVTNFEADTYDTRIFTLGQELPFAGHPTLGTAAAVRSRLSPTASELFQNCGIGKISIRFNQAKNTTHMVAPTATLQDIERVDSDRIAKACGENLNVKAASRIQVGPIWVTLITDNPSAIVAAKPNFEILTEISKKYGASGVQLAAEYQTAEGNLWKVRTFAPILGVSEDPICGSGNIALAALRRSVGLGNTDYVVKQGQEIGRDGEVFVRYLKNGEVEIGGATRLTARGELR